MKRYKVQMLPSALNDLQSARIWYKQHNPTLPRKFSKQIHTSLHRIIENPFAYAIRYKDIRVANINVFPYGIHYILTNNTVIIIAVHHSAMSIEKWINRI